MSLHNLIPYKASCFHLSVFFFLKRLIKRQCKCASLEQKSDEMIQWFFMHLSVKNQVEIKSAAGRLFEACEKVARGTQTILQPVTFGEVSFCVLCLFALFKKFFSKSEDRNQRQKRGKNEKAPIKAKNVLFCNCNVVNVVLYEYVFLPFSTPKSQMEHFLAFGSPNRGL